LLNEPHRWTDVQHHVAVEQFADEDRKRLAEIYWHHQRDEGEPAFNEFLSSLMDPNLQSLAVSLVEEFETLYEPESRLKEAIIFLADEKRREEENKQIAATKRTSVAANSGTPDVNGEKSPENDPDDWLRRQQEKARRPDLRRTGS
jgi:hypothetical protein